MGPILLFLLSLSQLHSLTHSETFNTPKFGANSVLENNEDDVNVLLPPEVEMPTEEIEEIPFVKTGHDKTEVEFRHPISSVNIDYSRNMIVLKFRKDQSKTRFKLDPEQEDKRKMLESNFMRFGRAPADFMRFGKRMLEEYPTTNSLDNAYEEDEAAAGRRLERSTEGMRDSRGDNFMRFGRASKDFMRFGRAPVDFMRFGRQPNKDFMRFGRGANDFMRFGRNPADFMRFGRGGPNDFMRFGRAPADFMRFGRLPSKDFMRFGRAQKLRQNADRNFIRFGRPDNFMRFGRASSDGTEQSTNFMRFGKMDQNFMRFGKDAKAEGSKNQTKAQQQKNDIREAAKLLSQTDKDADESNPMDKAIKVLFDKQRLQQQQEQQTNENDLQQKSYEDSVDLDADYGLNMAN